MKIAIVHFGQNPDKEEFYNLIVKVTDINSQDLSTEIRDELLTREFTIYHIDEFTIEANYKNRYMQVLQKLRELEASGWKM